MGCRNNGLSDQWAVGLLGGGIREKPRRVLIKRFKTFLGRTNNTMLPAISFYQKIYDIVTIHIDLRI